jgi:hypothetical protein
MVYHDFSLFIPEKDSIKFGTKVGEIDNTKELDVSVLPMAVTIQLIEMYEGMTAENRQIPTREEKVRILVAACLKEHPEVDEVWVRDNVPDIQLDAVSMYILKKLMDQVKQLKSLRVPEVLKNEGQDAQKGDGSKNS